MVPLVVVARRDALAEVAAHHPLIVLSPCGAACVEGRVWDEPAIRLQRETLDARRLSPGDPAQLHVPLDPRALAEARALRHARAAPPGPLAEGDRWVARPSRAPVRPEPSPRASHAVGARLNEMRVVYIRLLMREPETAVGTPA